MFGRVAEQTAGDTDDFYYTVHLPTFYRIHKNHKKEFTLRGGPTVLVSCLMFFQTATDYCYNSSLVFTTGFLTCV